MRHDWNVLATAQGGHSRALLAVLRDLGEFEPTVSKDVLVGVVGDRQALLDKVEERLFRDLRLPPCLGRLVPVERTVKITGTAPETALGDLVADMAKDIGSRTFHVRVDVHGHHEMHANHLELELADRIWDSLVSRGIKPRVRFADPDVVLKVEIVGDTAGAILVDRHTRLAYPFMRVR